MPRTVEACTEIEKQKLHRGFFKVWTPDIARQQQEATLMQQALSGGSGLDNLAPYSDVDANCSCCREHNTPVAKRGS